MTGYINDFIGIDVLISGPEHLLETSVDQGIQELFESHLQSTYANLHNLKQYGIDAYRIKIGDKLKLSPSNKTRQFCQEKGIPMGNDYDFSYEVSNIIMDFYSKNPRSEYDTAPPSLEIKIILTRLQN